MTTSNTEIKVGDYVRSFDFANPRDAEENRDLTGPNASYVEGTVVEIGKGDPDENPAGYTCYKILVQKWVLHGKPMKTGGHVYPPVNGTPSWLGGFTNGVEKITVTPVTVELGAYNGSPSIIAKMEETLKYIEDGAKSWAGTQEEYEKWALDIASGMLVSISTKLVTKAAK